MDASQATKELQNNLSDALDAKLKGKTLWLVDRAGIIDALVSIAMFLQRIDGLERYSHQFNELASVFMDLDQGKIHPIVLRNKKVKREALGRTDIWCARGRVAFAIHLLRRSGFKKLEAFSFAAKNYAGLKHLVLKSDLSKPLSASVANWYEKFLAKRVNNIEASEMYEDLVSESTDRFDTSEKSMADMRRFAERHLAVTATFEPLMKDDNVSVSSVAKRI